MVRLSNSKKGISLFHFAWITARTELAHNVENIFHLSDKKDFFIIHAACSDCDRSGFSDWS